MSIYYFKKNQLNIIFQTKKTHFSNFSLNLTKKLSLLCSLETFKRNDNIKNRQNKIMFSTVFRIQI